jgi:hypothetical protein
VVSPVRVGLGLLVGKELESRHLVSYDMMMGCGWSGVRGRIQANPT